MSDPADKHLEYAPKSVRLGTQQGGPEAAESVFPRFVRSANQQGSPGADNEIPSAGLRPSSESDATIRRRSLEPDITVHLPSSPCLLYTSDAATIYSV